MQAPHPSPELSIIGSALPVLPPVLPQLGIEVQRIPFDQPKAQCFRDCVAYLMREATALRSEHRHADALKHIDAALTLEMLIDGGQGDD